MVNILDGVLVLYRDSCLYIVLKLNEEQAEFERNRGIDRSCGAWNGAGGYLRVKTRSFSQKTRAKPAVFCGWRERDLLQLRASEV